MKACLKNPLLPHAAASPIKIGFFFLFIVATTLCAVVVRPAPNVNWIDSSGRQRGSAALKGQPVVVVIAPTPRDWLCLISGCVIPNERRTLCDG